MIWLTPFRLSVKLTVATGVLAQLRQLVERLPAGLVPLVTEFQDGLDLHPAMPTDAPAL